MEEIKVKEELEGKTYPNFKGFSNFGTFCIIVGVISLMIGIISLINSINSYSDSSSGLYVGGLISGFFVFCFLGGVLKVLVQIEKNTRK